VSGYKTPWHDPNVDPGAFGNIMINRIVCSLSVEERHEYLAFQKIKRRRRSPEQQSRMEALWQLATELEIPNHLGRASQNCTCPPCAQRRADEGRPPVPEVWPDSYRWRPGDN
jgi:hypothetical protein